MKFLQSEQTTSTHQNPLQNLQIVKFSQSKQNHELVQTFLKSKFQEGPLSRPSTKIAVSPIISTASRLEFLTMARKKRSFGLKKAANAASDEQKQNQYDDPYKGYQSYEDDESDDDDDDRVGVKYEISNYDFYDGPGSSCGVRQIFAHGEDRKESALQKCHRKSYALFETFTKQEEKRSVFDRSLNLITFQEETRRFVCLTANEQNYESISKDLLHDVDASTFEAHEGNDTFRHSLFQIVPFFYWLFIHNAPENYEEPMCYPCNFRKVDSEQLSHVEDQLKLPGSSPEGTLLQDRSIDAFAYSVEEFDGVPQTPLESISNFATRKGGKKYSGTSALMVGQHAIALQQKACATLSAFLGFRREHGLTWSNGRFSWEKVFEKFNEFQGLGSDVGILNSLLEKLELPFRYSETSDVGICNKHFKSYFRSIVNIDMAPIEGGHRTWILNKKMIGHHLRTIVPCRVGVGNFTVSKQSSLGLKMGIMICPWTTGEVFSTHKLSLLSRNLHETRNRSFVNSWSMLLQHLFRECTKRLAEKQINYSQFLAMSFDEDEFVQLILTIKTAVLDVCFASELIWEEIETSNKTEAFAKIRQTILDTKTFKKAKIINYVSHSCAENHNQKLSELTSSLVSRRRRGLSSMEARRKASDSLPM